MNALKDLARDKHLFGGNREKAIQRDGEKCVSCGMTRQEHRNRYSADITVDHIDGKGKNTPVPKKNNNLDNLQTLCLPCHGKKDRARNTSQSKITREDAEDIRLFYANNVKTRDIAKVYPIGVQAIGRILRGEIWVGPTLQASLKGKP